MEHDNKIFIILKIKETVKWGDIFKLIYYKINKDYNKYIINFYNNIVLYYI